jgi:uncharacterized protein (TIGR00266 family)
MQSEITGTTLPVLQVQLVPGETLIAETGQLAWMTPTIAMTTTTQTGGVRGLFGAIARAFGGGGLFMTEFTAATGPGGVAFAAHVPGQIMEVDVAAGRPYMLHRNGFLCAMQGVVIGTAFQQSFKSGLFGGAGFVLQKLEGQGKAWVELGGDIVIYELQPGETLLVHPGLVGMFEASVAFEVTRVPGIKNILFGGEGLFLVKLTGPGRVWLQTLALASLAHAIDPYLSHDKAGVVVGGESASSSDFSFSSSDGSDQTNT